MYYHNLYVNNLKFYLYEKVIDDSALISMIVFMYGLAAGRLISMIIDGVPHWLLIVYLILEILFGTLALILVRKDLSGLNN